MWSRRETDHILHPAAASQQEINTAPKQIRHGDEPVRRDGLSADFPAAQPGRGDAQLPGQGLPCHVMFYSHPFHIFKYRHYISSILFFVRFYYNSLRIKIKRFLKKYFKTEILILQYENK
jgi:hypothetical protein